MSLHTSSHNKRIHSADTPPIPRKRFEHDTSSSASNSSLDNQTSKDLFANGFMAEPEILTGLAIPESYLVDEYDGLYSIRDEKPVQRQSTFDTPLHDISNSDITQYENPESTQPFSSLYKLLKVSPSGRSEYYFDGVSERDFKCYNKFEMDLYDHPELDRIIYDIVNDNITPYKLTTMFKVDHCFQSYIRVAKWSEFRNYFTLGVLNDRVKLAKKLHTRYCKIF